MSEDKLTKYQKLEKELTIQKKSCWEVWDQKTIKQSFDFANDYKKFLDLAKTEIEAVREGIKMAEKAGFKNIEKLKSIKAGDKVYFNQKGKSLILAKIGQEDLIKNGFKMLMSHVDSPHLDFKLQPLFEDEKLAFLKTHYYGGIRKYQWPTITLALHGVVYLENNKEVEITIGEKQDDPIFMITDLLPHLDRNEAGAVTGMRDIKGEELNLLVGSIPIDDKKVKNKVKLAVLEYLFNNYGIKENDLTSMDMQAVPSKKARDLGFDRSLISGYGHDDKVCSYPALKALFNTKNKKNTQICIWVDREEIGSEGSTGAQGFFVERFITELLKLTKKEVSLSQVYEIFANSTAISADVTPAVDPDYKNVHDLKNANRMGFGLAMEKYTGFGGKYSTSEADAKFVRDLKNIFNKNKVVYQMSGGLGKIDQGGGGTIAKYMAKRGIEIVDMGVPVFNMHAPLEIISKADLYSAYLGYLAFLDN